MEITERIETLASELAGVQTLRLDVSNSLREVEENVKSLEIYAPLDASIDGKNETIRQAQIRQLLNSTEPYTKGIETIRKGRQQLGEMDIKIELLRTRISAAKLEARLLAASLEAGQDAA
jgi:hypothetical protein